MAKMNFYDVPEVGVHPQYDVSLEKLIRAIDLLYASTGRRAAEMTTVRIDWMTKRRRARSPNDPVTVARNYHAMSAVLLIRSKSYRVLKTDHT